MTPGQLNFIAGEVTFEIRTESPPCICPLYGTDPGGLKVLPREMHQLDVCAAAITLLATLLINPLDSRAFFSPFLGTNEGALPTPSL